MIATPVSRLESLSLSLPGGDKTANPCGDETGTISDNASPALYHKLVRHYYIVTGLALAMMRFPRIFMPVLSSNPQQLQRILSANQGLASLPQSLGGLALRALPALAAEWLGMAP